MFLDEFSKEIQKKFLMTEFIAGWQNKSGKVQIMIIGTAPGMIGSSVNRKPLSNSHSTKVLWDILYKANYHNETIYLTNLIKYPLLNNKEPTEKDITNNLPILREEILKYNPKVVICLGKHSMTLFGLRTYEQKMDEFGITFLSINHPGYYIRKPGQINTAIDFLKSKKYLFE